MISFYTNKNLIMSNFFCEYNVLLTYDVPLIIPFIKEERCVIKKKCSIRYIPILFCLMSIIFFQTFGFAAVQEGPPDKPKAAQYAVTKATSEILVDGVLDDPAWISIQS